MNRKYALFSFLGTVGLNLILWDGGIRWVNIVLAILAVPSLVLALLPEARNAD